jgi:hypothetical protein
MYFLSGEPMHYLSGVDTLLYQTPADKFAECVAATS